MGMGAQQPGQQPQVPPQGGKAGGGQAPTTPGQVPPQGGKGALPVQHGYNRPQEAPPGGQPNSPAQAAMMAQWLAATQRGQAPTTPGQVPPQGGKAQQPGQPQLPPQPTGYPPVQLGHNRPQPTYDPPVQQPYGVQPQGDYNQQRIAERMARRDDRGGNGQRHGLQQLMNQPQTVHPRVLGYDPGYR